MDISAVLQENWFTDKEAKIYLSTLELGNAPASSIARHCGENRITVYTILKDLTKRGIVSEITRDKVKYYIALNPKQLIALQNKKAKKLEWLLPELLAINNDNINKPKVYYYEWFEWLKKVYEDHLVSKKPLLSFLWVSEIEESFKNYLYNDFLPRRVEAKVYAKVIVPAEKDNKIYAVKDTKNLKETLVLNSPLFNTDNEIVIYWESKVSISMFSKNEMSWLIIDSKTLHDTLASIFNLTWETYKDAGR